MNEHRRKILEMLAVGKITAEEADRLLAALEPDATATVGTFPGATGSSANSADSPARSRARYLRVLVEADESKHGMRGPTTVNVRVPMQLLRAGVRLASLIPVQAQEQLDEALNRHGVPFTVSQIKPENLEELIDHLEDLTVDVDAKDEKAKVRVFCE